MRNFYESILGMGLFSEAEDDGGASAALEDLGEEMTKATSDAETECGDFGGGFGDNCQACEDDDDYEDDFDDIDDDDDDDEPSDAEIDAFDGFGDDEDDVAPVPANALTPDQEMEADKYMSMMGTAALVQSELDDSAKENFAESGRDLAIAVNEGLISESYADHLRETYGYFTEAKYNKPTLIRLSKKDKLAQLYAVAIYAVARSRNDPDFERLKLLNKKRRILKLKLKQKYDAPAKQRMKVYFRRLQNSKSTPLANLAKKIQPST